MPAPSHPLGSAPKAPSAEWGPPSDSGTGSWPRNQLTVCLSREHPSPAYLNLSIRGHPWGNPFHESFSLCQNVPTQWVGTSCVNYAGSPAVEKHLAVINVSRTSLVFARGIISKAIMHISGGDMSCVTIVVRLLVLWTAGTRWGGASTILERCPMWPHRLSVWLHVHGNTEHGYESPLRCLIFAKDCIHTSSAVKTMMFQNLDDLHFVLSKLRLLALIESPLWRRPVATPCNPLHCPKLFPM